jgi:membrane associated rhomboid family serine protease
MQITRHHLSLPGTPPVVSCLLIINVVLFLAQQQFAQTILWWLALWPLNTPHLVISQQGLAIAPQFHVWQLLTYGFLHATIMHIFFNMFALWMFGRFVESVWGWRRFLFFYLVCVIGSGVTQLGVLALFTDPGGGLFPTIGASGGIFGVLLAFGMMFPEERIMLIIPPIPMKAKYFVIGYAVLELVLGVTGTEAGVAHFAHLGGLFFGLMLILYWRGKLPVKPHRRRF